MIHGSIREGYDRQVVHGVLADIAVSATRCVTWEWRRKFVNKPDEGRFFELTNKETKDGKA